MTERDVVMCKNNDTKRRKGRREVQELSYRLSGLESGGSRGESEDAIKRAFCLMAIGGRLL